jgi:hypothetical protein
MQDPQSLHKYLYVHGDPVQGIDPTGLILSGFSLGFAIGFTLPIAASFVVWHFEEQAANRPGVITPWLLLTRPSEYDTHGTWRAWGYLRTVLGRFPNADEQTTAGDGCIGLLRVRLGLSGGGRTPWNEISNTKAFIAKHPTDNSVNFDSALNEALAVYNTFASDGDLDQPWLYMFVNRSVGLPVAPTLRAGSLEVNPADVSFAEVGDFNYASRLLLKDGNTTWESAIEGRTSMWTTLFWRHDLDKTDGDQVYVFVSPKRNPAMVDVR